MILSIVSGWSRGGCEGFSGNKTSVVWMRELGVCLDNGFQRQGSCALRKTEKALSWGQRRGNFRYHKLLLRCFWARRIKAQSFPEFPEYLIIKIMISMKAVHMSLSHFFPWKIMIQNSKKCFVCYNCCFFPFFLPYLHITVADHKTKTMSWRMLTCSVKLGTTAESHFTLPLINMPYCKFNKTVGQPRPPNPHLSHPHIQQLLDLLFLVLWKHSED